MGTNYRPYEPDQPFLFLPSPRDWLPRDHLAYFISDTLDQLDLSALHQPYEGDGRRNQPYHPTMLKSRCSSTPTRRACFRRAESPAS